MKPMPKWQVVVLSVLLLLAAICFALDGDVVVAIVALTVCLFLPLYAVVMCKWDEDARHMGIGVFACLMGGFVLMDSYVGIGLLIAGVFYLMRGMYLRRHKKDSV
jgi:hypothetical protein